MLIVKKLYNIKNFLCKKYKNLQFFTILNKFTLFYYTYSVIFKKTPKKAGKKANAV